MEYKIINKPTYNLHMIKTNKFKTIVFKVIFRKEITQREISLRNLLIDNLIFSNKYAKTRKEMVKRKQDLYGTEIFGSNTRAGNHLLTELTLSILNPKYTENTMLDESLKFFCDTLFAPNIEDGGFAKENFEITKEDNLTIIKGEKENSSRTAITNLKKLVAKNASEDSPIALDMNGRKEDIEKITREDLYKYYQDEFFKSIIDIYVIGDFDFYEMSKKIEEYFKFHYLIKEKKPLRLSYPKTRSKPKEVIEESSFIQSRLAMALYFSSLTEKERKYVSTLLTIILGGSPESKLFLNVREKNSYAYSISANYYKTDDFFLITAGISYKNYKNVLKEIKNELNNLKSGKISDYELTNAKELVISVLNDIFESPASIIDYYFNMELLDHDDLKTQIAIFKDITKDEIITLASKLQIDIIYLLKEKENRDAKITDQ